MADQSKQLTFAEYFAGIGLVRMGLEPCGWRVVYANDFSQKKFEMYKDFFPDAHAHYEVEDIFKVDKKRIPHSVLATCSFPCIDLSLAGNMNGIGGKHSSAFWGFAQALRAQGESAPPLILVENVPGWLSSNKGADFRVTLEALNQLGYACDVFVLDALRFTPQSRLRVFLVGSRKHAAAGAVEKILGRPSSLLSPTLAVRLQDNADLDWFYIDLPDPPELRRQGLSEIVEKLPETDERWWPEEEVQRHLAMMDDSHRARVDKLIQQEQISYRTFYRRRRRGLQRAEVRHNDTAGCLRTAVGGSGKQFLIEAGGARVRMRTMTATEYALLQGVPSRYKTTVNGVHALTGFGDAVCVPVISWIAKFALNPLLNRECPDATEP